MLRSFCARESRDLIIILCPENDDLYFLFHYVPDAYIFACTSVYIRGIDSKEIVKITLLPFKRGSQSELEANGWYLCSNRTPIRSIYVKQI